MLTRKQRDLLLFINDFINEHGVSPSFDEMKEALDLKSKSGIHRLITALEEQFEIAVDDDEVSAETFETLGTLTAFVEEKL